MMNTHPIRLGTLALALLLALGSSTAAQIDLGIDGIDQDCADFFELNAAQAYFATDGGSATRNVDNLDPSGDGRAAGSPVDPNGASGGIDERGNKASEGCAVLRAMVWVQFGDRQRGEAIAG